jgi:phosphoenolpyruvate carboxylase
LSAAAAAAVLQVIDAITRHLDLGSYLEWSEEQRTAWLMEGEKPQTDLLQPAQAEMQQDQTEEEMHVVWVAGGGGWQGYRNMPHCRF